MTRILYIKHADSTFVLNDQYVLESEYTLIPYVFFRGRKGLSFLVDLIRLKLFLLSHLNGDTIFVTWFGDYHSALMAVIGKIFRKKVIIFVGGQEAVSYPELGKGVYRSKIRGFCVRYALKNASLILPNHASLLYHENYYYMREGKKDGIRHYVKKFKTPVSIIPNGTDTAKFRRDPSIMKEKNRILTVGTMNSQGDFVNKGFDLFIEMARRNPDLNFTLIGIKKPFLPLVEEQYRLFEIKNLEIILSYCPDERLILEYNRAAVFVQASITEGMPNTLNEAMLCECIPVGSNVNGIPDAMGDTGVMVMQRDVVELEKAVREALKMTDGSDARSHALRHFTKEIRGKKILEVFSTFDPKSRP